MRKKLALILGILFLIDSFVFGIINVGNPVEWKYWLMPNFTVDSGMMVICITFYAAVAGYLLGWVLNSKE